MKLGPVTKAFLVVGFGCLSLVAIRYIDTIPARRLYPTPLSTPSPTPPQKESVDGQTSRSAVSVQTFFGATLRRSGSGTIVSSDGLILTSATVAPYGSGSFAYQIATSSGSLLRAHSVWRRMGLVLLKVQASDLDAVFFDQATNVISGQEATVIGAFVSLSRYVPVVLPASIPYVSQGIIPLSIDRSFASVVAGGHVTDAHGNAIGIFVPGSPLSTMIPAQAVNAFIEEYLATIQKR